MNTSKPLTFGSLFAGIGGFDLGFERAGMVCKWQVEIDEYAQRVLAKHWPGVRRWDDVRTWPQPDTERVDVICGGFPCQDISFAGKGAGLAGERSGLFYEVIRIVREMEPRIVVLENVAALLVRGMGDVLGSLASIGLDSEWHCIPAAAVGAPHIRDRVFIISYAQGVGRGTRGTRGIAGAGPREKDSAELANAESSGREAGAGLWGNGKSSGRGKSAWSSEVARFGSQWATESGVGRVAHGIPARVDRIRGLGNAVVPQVAEWIGRRLAEPGIDGSGIGR